MPAMWRVRFAEPARASALARACGLDPVTAQLLLHRGVSDPAAAARFLHPRLGSLEDPSRLPDLARAQSRMTRAIARREPILIFGDSDLDGLTASVILSEVLSALGGIVRVQSSNRVRDGYGAPASLVERLRGSGTRVVILVDCGTNQADVVRELSEYGIDVIIVDHHIPLAGWATPHALVNPHQTGGRGRELCSAGLAFKLAQALLGPRRRAALRDYLDLATLGTLSDCVPLVGENRLIVAEGLARIVESRRPGLRRVCEATQTTKADPEQIVKRLVPRFNASGRLGDPSAVRHLLQHDESDQTQMWMEQAEAAHATTKRLYRQMVAEAEDHVHRQHFGEQFVLVVSRSGWHQGLTGILASQLAARYQRPAIAIALGAHRGIGSGRSIPRYDLLSALKACQALLVRFGGHAQACGLTVEGRQVERFRMLINQHGRLTLGREGLVPTRSVDLELPLEAIQPRWVEETRAFAPFGRGNERPTVMIRRVTITPASSRTATLSDGARGIAARGAWAGIRADERYDVVATPTLEEETVRLMVSDVKVSAGP